MFCFFWLRKLRNEEVQIWKQEEALTEFSVISALFVYGSRQRTEQTGKCPSVCVRSRTAELQRLIIGLNSFSLIWRVEIERVTVFSKTVDRWKPSIDVENCLTLLLSLFLSSSLMMGCERKTPIDD